MAKRDPAKTARNKRVREIKARLGDLVEDVKAALNNNDVLSIHAKIGCRYQSFLDIKRMAFSSPDEFAAAYLMELTNEVKRIPAHMRADSSDYQLALAYQQHDCVREYVDLYLERSFLSKYDEYSRIKPSAVEDTLWIGGNNVDYGLLITPRFNHFSGDWENDKSEIRKFGPKYYTVGHVLESGLVIPGRNQRRKYDDVDQFLDDYEQTLVRSAGSSHQDAVAERYCEYVRDAEKPLDVPLLIPELRYKGRDKKHKYRLDFCVIDGNTMSKMGYELSPWSTHGKLTGTKNKTVKAVNEEAQANFEKEIRKYESYFSRYNIPIKVFTDSDLGDPDAVFAEIKKGLSRKPRINQLLLHSKKYIMDTDLAAEWEDDTSD